MKAFHKQATQYYVRSSQLFHTNIVHSPALFLLSKTDTIGAVKSNMRVRDSWDSLGIKVSLKKKNREKFVFNSFLYEFILLFFFADVRKNIRRFSTCWTFSKISKGIYCGIVCIYGYATNDTGCGKS